MLVTMNHGNKDIQSLISDTDQSTEQNMDLSMAPSTDLNTDLMDLDRMGQALMVVIAMDLTKVQDTTEVILIITAMDTVTVTVTAMVVMDTGREISVTLQVIEVLSTVIKAKAEEEQSRRKNCLII